VQTEPAPLPPAPPDLPSPWRWQESFIDAADGALCIATTFCAGGDLAAEIQLRASGAAAGAAGAGGGAAAAAAAAGAAARRGAAGAAAARGGGSGRGGAAAGAGVARPRYFSEDEVMDLFLQVGVAGGWGLVGRRRWGGRGGEVGRRR
jgi:hypothetical protein